MSYCVESALPLQTTPNDASEESITGKVYGFFQNIGSKLKTAFNCIKDFIG